MNSDSVFDRQDVEFVSPAHSTDAELDLYSTSDLSDVDAIDLDDVYSGVVCTCGSNGRAHKRDCPKSYKRGGLGGAAPPPPPPLSSPGAPRVQGPSPPTCAPPPREIRPPMNVGDHVCVHSRKMDKHHLPCCIAAQCGDRYRVYCPKGTLITSFSASELTSRVRGPVIPLVDWRQASKVSLQSVSTDPALLELCECDLPVTSEAVVISLESEGENEAPEVWVSNGAYSLSHGDRQLVLSKRGWLTDQIISAAQSLLLQLFPSMAGLQPPVLQKVQAF